MRWGNTGGLPVIVLSPVDVRDCYVLTMRAFNLAEQFRCPVFLATNKEISMTRESIDLDTLPTPAVVDRRMAPADKTFVPFATAEGQAVPDFLPIGDQQTVRQTSSTHGPDGYITTDPDVIEQFQERLNDKIVSAVDAFTFYEEATDETADTLLITYGITARSARVAAEQLHREGRPVSLLILKTLWPVPGKTDSQKSRKRQEESLSRR